MAKSTRDHLQSEACHPGRQRSEQLDISADGQRLYVANEDAAQVSVVDVPSGTVIATVKMGDEPEGVTIRPDGKVVYVTSEDEGAVYAIDTATNKVLKKVPVGHRPRSIGFLPDGSRAFVSLENEFSSDTNAREPSGRNPIERGR